MMKNEMSSCKFPGKYLKCCFLLGNKCGGHPIYPIDYKYQKQEFKCVQLMIKCDICKHDDEENVNQIERLIVCNSCFKKEMNIFYEIHGLVPIGLKELNEIFYKFTIEGKRELKEKSRYKPMF